LSLLIRVAMLYNDKVGYGPTVSAALDAIFGAGAGATAAAPAPAAGAGAPPAKPAEGAAPPAAVGEIPAPPVAVPGPGGSTLSAARAAALAEIESALGAVREAQKSGNFGQYGAALQRLDEAMGKFDAAK